MFPSVTLFRTDLISFVASLMSIFAINSFFIVFSFKISYYSLIDEDWDECNDFYNLLFYNLDFKLVYERLSEL